MKLATILLSTLSLLGSKQATGFWPAEFDSSAWPRHFASPHARQPFGHQHHLKAQPQNTQHQFHDQWDDLSNFGRPDVFRRDPSRAFHGLAADGQPTQSPVQQAADSKPTSVQYLLSVPHGVIHQGLKYSFEGYDKQGDSWIRLYTGELMRRSRSLHRPRSRVNARAEPQAQYRRDMFGRVFRHTPQAFSQDYLLPVRVLPSSLRLTGHGASQVRVQALVQPQPQQNENHNNNVLAEEAQLRDTPRTLASQSLPAGQQRHSDTPRHDTVASLAQRAMKRLGVQSPVDVQHRAASPMPPCDWCTLEEVHAAQDRSPPTGTQQQQYDGYEYRGEWHEY